MLPTLPTTQQPECSATPLEHDQQDAIETRLRLDEHIWLYQILRSEQDEAGTIILRQARHNMAQRAQGRPLAPAS